MLEIDVKKEASKGLEEGNSAVRIVIEVERTAAPGEGFRSKYRFRPALSREGDVESYMDTEEFFDENGRRKSKPNQWDFDAAKGFEDKKFWGGL